MARFAACHQSLFTPDLWVAQSDYFLTNSGIFIRDGQAVLIDPCMRRDEIDAIAEFVQAQHAAPRWLVLTHSHWDHILGPERFPGVPNHRAGPLPGRGCPRRGQNRG